MTKSELIERVSELLKLPNGKAEQIVNCIFDSMVTALQNGDGIEIRGFGSFTVREYKSYEGRNPRTGDTVHVAPKRLPFFKVGKDLRERVNTVWKEEPAESGLPVEPSSSRKEPHEADGLSPSRGVSGGSSFGSSFGTEPSRTGPGFDRPAGPLRPIEPTTRPGGGIGSPSSQPSTSTPEDASSISPGDTPSDTTASPVPTDPAPATAPAPDRAPGTPPHAPPDDAPGSSSNATNSSGSSGVIGSASPADRSASPADRASHPHESERAQPNATQPPVPPGSGSNWD